MLPLAVSRSPLRPLWTMNESTTPGAADQSLDEDTVAELVKRADRAAKANINGDHRLYFSLFDHPDDYTLMPPNGGPTWHGFGLTDADIEEGGTFFAAGEAALEVEQTYVAGEPGGVGGYRAAARRGRRDAGTGLVAAAHAGVPPVRRPVGNRPPACRSAGPRDFDGAPRPAGSRREHPRRWVDMPLSLPAVLRRRS